MAYFTKKMLSEISTQKIFYSDKRISKATEAISDNATFDIFLSHSYRDKDYIINLKKHIEGNFQLTCYVDWISEPTLNRSDINPNTAKTLRKRMQQSRSFLYCTSENSPNSKWMPWELGFFDAYKGKVAILPLVDEAEDPFDGQEYLSLYPYVDSNMLIGANKSSSVSFKNWLGRDDNWTIRIK